MAKKDKNDRAIARKLDSLEYEYLWEDYSKNQEIEKILKKSSKNGEGNIGLPDHLYINENKKILILIEDKPRINMHTSGDIIENYIQGCITKAIENSKIKKKEKKKKIFDKEKKYNPEKYAVDGLIWYMNFFKQKNILNEVSKDYFCDWKIIGIAVSGDLEDEYNHSISTFVLVEDKIIEQPINKLNNEIDYINMFNNIIEECLVDSITQSSKKINKQLRAIDSQDRPILLSALMICLFEHDNNNVDNSFITQYKSQKFQTVANNIEARVDSILKAEGILEQKRKVIISKLEFVKTDATLTQTNVLIEILDELRTNVISKFKISSNYDIIGKFYEEFLKYAGVANVKKGIVLTPQHITTLFTELIPIEKDDVIFDGCCGTGAFLIAGMNKLLKIHEEIQENKTKVLLQKIDDTEILNLAAYLNIINSINFEFNSNDKNYNQYIYTDNEKNMLIEKIATLNILDKENVKSTIIQERILQKKSVYDRVKNNQLVGFEINPTMYSLAISNMIFRGDGKSRIFYEDFFSEAAKKELNLLKEKGIKPTIGFINPPYGGKNNNDNPTKKEIQFLQLLLQSVEKYAVMIAPLSTYFKDEKIRNNILKKNTLKYVINMPKDLFMPNAATNTAISVFEVNKPQNDREVVFFDLKDDGFILNKNKGRTDILGKWEEIKNEMLETIQADKFQGDNIKSLKTKLNKNDEWLIYAHSATDYEKLTEDYFGKVIKEYLVFKAKKEQNLFDKDISDIEMINIIADYYNEYVECSNCKKEVDIKFSYCPYCANEIKSEEKNNGNR